MKKTFAAAPILAAITLTAALAAPLSAQAHRAWIMPTSTVLSGGDAWVGFDAGMSTNPFVADHAAMRLDNLVVTAPDGSTLQPEHVNQAQYRSTFDVHLTQPGTYRIANVGGGLMATYMLDGEQKRWRGRAEEFPAAIPAGATDVVATRNTSRTETFVTLGARAPGLEVDLLGAASLAAAHGLPAAVEVRAAGQPLWRADLYAPPQIPPQGAP
jgi:hypothetical protein